MLYRLKKDIRPTENIAFFDSDKNEFVDGFYVEIDYDFWKDEKHKLETFHHLARYFPNIERLDDDDLCHISLDGDNFNEVAL